jgi:hypothetical protein
LNVTAHGTAHTAHGTAHNPLVCVYLQRKVEDAKRVEERLLGHQHVAIGRHLKLLTRLRPAVAGPERRRLAHALRRHHEGCGGQCRRPAFAQLHVRRQEDALEDGRRVLLQHLREPGHAHDRSVGIARCPLNGGLHFTTTTSFLFYALALSPTLNHYHVVLGVNTIINLQLNNIFYLFISLKNAINPK